jgi:cyclic pyranopterin phosphate synthase
MPKEVFGRDYDFLPRSEILNFEEIARLVRVFVSLGVEKVRLTGGEPLLRKDLERLVGELAGIAGLQDLTLTTNGSLLAQKAAALRSAGLHRVTVSLDALDEPTFAAMNDVGFPISRVLEGIDAALQVGFRPIKINAVIRRGVNEHSIAALAERFGGAEYIVRFIEYMDVGHSNGWRLDEVVPASEIEGNLRDSVGLVPLPANYSGEVARRFRTAEGGEVGIIASVTQPFCRGCTRARLTADGRLYTCLFGTHGHDIRAALRADLSDDQFSQLMRGIWLGRNDRYSEIRSAATARDPKVEMSAIGG